MKYILLISLLITSGVKAQTVTNLLRNPGFENGKQTYTNSGGTFSITTNASNVLEGKQSASFQASSTGQYLESSLVVIPKGLENQDCMASISYSGGDANLGLTVLNSSNASVTNGLSKVLESASGPKIAKIYFVCPTGSIKWRLTSTAASALTYIDSTVISASDKKESNPIGEWQSFTPLFQSSGTQPTIGNGSIVGKYRLEGGFVYGEISFNSGTTSSFGSGDFYFRGLPYLIDTAAATTTSQRAIGSAQYTTNGVFYSGAAAIYSTNALVVHPNQGGSVLSSSSYTWTLGSSNIFLQFKYPAIGVPNSDKSISAKCYDPLKCENTFTAYVLSDGTVTQENLNWINGNCSGSSPYTCTYNSSIFGQAPNCTFTNISDGGGYITAINSTSFTYRAITTTTGAALNTAFMVSCSRSSSDFKYKQDITGYLNGGVTSSRTPLKIEYGLVSSICSTSPCTVSSNRSSPSVSSVTRTASGDYVVNWVAGTWNTGYTCSSNSYNAGSFAVDIFSVGLSTAQIKSRNSATGVLTDTSFTFMCTGL